MSGTTQTKKSNPGGVDLITELFQDLISDIVDLNPYSSNAYLLKYLNMKHSDSKQLKDSIRTLPRKSLSDERVNIDTVSDNSLCKSNSWSCLMSKGCNSILQRVVGCPTKSLIDKHSEQGVLFDTKSCKYDLSQTISSSTLSSLSSTDCSIRVTDDSFKNYDGIIGGSGGHLVDQKQKFSLSNLEKIEEYPEIEFESRTKAHKMNVTNLNKASIQRLRNSRKNIGDVIDPEEKCTKVYSIDANTLGKTKYHTILSLAPKDTITKPLRRHESNNSSALTGNIKENVENKLGNYQCFQVLSSTVVKSSSKPKVSKSFKEREINSTKVINKKQKQNKGNCMQKSKSKMNSFELSERMKHFTKRINLNKLNKNSQIDANFINHAKLKTKTSLTVPPISTCKQQKTTKTTQPKLQVSPVGRPISPSWITKQYRENQTKNKKFNHSIQKFCDKTKSKRDLNFVAKRIEFQPTSKNCNDTKTCHLKLVLAEMDRCNDDSKQFINSTVAERLRNIFQNIKEKKTSPKILVKPPQISNEYEKEKLMNSIPSILNSILQRSSSTSTIQDTIEFNNRKKNNVEYKMQSRNYNTPLEMEAMREIRRFELKSLQKNDYKEREGKFINSETKLLNSIKPEDIRPMSAEYSKQKKLKSEWKSTQSLPSIEENEINTLPKIAQKLNDHIKNSTNSLIASQRKNHKQKVSVLKFNDILKLKRLSNTLASYFRRSNRSFETIIPLTVQCLYDKGKVLTKNQYTLWKQYNAKNCVVSVKSGDNPSFARPYTPLIEVPLKARKSSQSQCMQHTDYDDRLPTKNTSSQDIVVNTDTDEDQRDGRSISTSSNITHSVFSAKSLSSSHYTSDKYKEEIVLKVINAELDDDINFKNDPTLGGILGLTVDNLKNNDMQSVKSITKKEPNHCLYKQYPPINDRKTYSNPMFRRFHNFKNGRTRAMQDHIDFKSAFVC